MPVELSNAILLEASLSFLGLGIRPPDPSWGLMLAEAKEDIFFAPSMITIPGVALFILVFSTGLIGEEGRKRVRKSWSMSALAVEHLQVDIGTGKDHVRAVRDVSFRIEQRRVLGIVGESGSGKSTAALALMGLLPLGSLEELRFRLIMAIIGLLVGMTLCFIFGQCIISFIVAPYLKAVSNNPNPASRLLILGPAEGFISYCNICLISGLILASPWVFYHLWMFVAAGLYPHEKKYVYMTIPFSIALFIIGALFFMFFVAPLTIKILIKFNENILAAQSSFTFQQYVSFVTTMMLTFGLTFQTPLVILCLNRTGLISLEAFHRSRKYAILAIVIIASVIIPSGDVISMFSLAIPMYLLFELGIILSWLAEKRAKARKKHRTHNDIRCLL